MPKPRLLPAALRGASCPLLAVAALMLVVLVAAAHLTSDVLVTGMGATFLVVLALGWGRLLLAEGVRLLSTPVLVGKNLPLSIEPVRPAPEALARELGPEVVAPVLVGLSLAAGNRVVVGSIAMSVSVVVAVAAPAWLALRAVRLRRSRYRHRMAEAVSDAVASLAPEVVLYFAGRPEELYQVEGWLRPVEQLGRPALVLVRNHDVVTHLRTSLPVVSSTYTAPITRLSLPARFVGLFVTHSGDNVVMLRKAGVVSVFVGHGDSDKPDSINPVARAYDQVWVAGPLGRRRYAEAGIGVSDAAIVEVGRPQVSASSPPDATVSVLYAPTWEGWGDDPHHSSLAHVGVALVRALLASDVEVRYRPHPLTGRRDPAMRAAHRDIVQLLAAAPNGDVIRPVSEQLASSFAAASAMVADVSSVVSEFLSWDRPYAVVDTRGLGAAQLTARFPSTAGGFVLGPDLANLEALLVAARGGTDATAVARRDLLLDTMGDPATSWERFAAAVAAALQDHAESGRF